MFEINVSNYSKYCILLSLWGVAVIYVVIGGQTFWAVATGIIFHDEFEHHLGVSGCLPSFHSLATTAHAPCILTSVHTSRSSKALTKMLNVAGRRSLVTGWNRLLFRLLKRTISQRTFNRRKCRLDPWLVRDMELKKSISDTERALRSYGAVSETAWTTDKGERPAGTCCWTEGRADGGACSSETVKRWLTKVRRVLISLLLKGPLINSTMCTAWCLCVDMGPGTNQ